MAIFKCKKCGYIKESRCKPKKCPECKEENSFEKVSLEKEK
ncbi:RCKP-type rubredoxin-like domain-containing protein [Thermodesulfobium sp.]|jgi:rubrerythrin|uniref:Rubredoxin n=1 Tax=Thermodesulfobium narugense TaxID=184064 RepID=A0A7C5KD64_9BACT